MRATQRMFFPDRKKIKKYFNLKRSWKDPKLCALKIKIKFDDIISIKILFQACEIYQNIQKKNKVKLKLILIYTVLNKK
jgi:hypothetical protein